MTKISWYVNSNANIHSCYRETVDLEEVGLQEDWGKMTEEEKEKVIFEDFVSNQMEWGWEEDV